MKKKNSVKPIIMVLVIAIGVIFMNCKSADPVASTETSAAYDQLVTLLEANDAFRIDVDAVRPYNTAATTKVLNNLMSTTGNIAGRIDVAGAGHYLEVRDDMVKGSLSYFGEQRQGGSMYGRANGGIEFEGTPEDYELVPNPDKNRVAIKFKADDGNKGTEHYDVIITVFPGGTADIRISSSQRSTIAYSGSWTRLEDKL